MGKKSRYGVMIDAGSSGTRLYVYKWKDPAISAKSSTGSPDRMRLPKIKLEKTVKIRPGVSAFADVPYSIGPEHLQQLVDEALDEIPDDKISDTPVFLMATAGMRLLPTIQQNALLSESCSYFQKHTKFHIPDCKTHFEVIPGETEGLYGWIAANYLLGGFDEPHLHNHGKGHTTYGFLDMGGASAQIAFAPNSTETIKHYDDLKLVRLRTLDGQPAEYKVFTATWLGFGANKARDRYLDKLIDMYTDRNSEDNNKGVQIPDPCLPKGLRTTLRGERLAPEISFDGPVLIGTGVFQDCLVQTNPLLEKNAVCPDEPCLLNGQHVPAIDFDVLRFVGVSEYYHTTHGVFGGGKGDKAYDLEAYQKTVADFCAKDWTDVEALMDSAYSSARKTDQKIRDAQEACFKASWIMNVLYEGVGIPRYGLDDYLYTGPNATLSTAFPEPFRPVDSIDGVEVSWTMGKMVLYASGQVPTNGTAPPVGFGSNGQGLIPPDFEYAGSSPNPIPPPDTAWDGDWEDAADEILNKAPDHSGLVVLFVLLGLLAFFFRKRERRMRFSAKIGSLFKRHHHHHYHHHHHPSTAGPLPFQYRNGAPRKLSRAGPSLASKLFGGRGSVPSGYEPLGDHGDDVELGVAGAEADSSLEILSSPLSPNLGLHRSISRVNVNANVGTGSSGGVVATDVSPIGGGTGLGLALGGLGGGSVVVGGGSNGGGGGLVVVDAEDYSPTHVHGNVGSVLPSQRPRSATIDRSGLVIRTESRDNLAPMIQMLNAGRRSRAASPTRQKSPLNKD